MVVNNQLIVRSIKRAELDAFSSFAAGRDRGFAPQGSANFRDWLLDLWRTKQSAPERCFVACKPEGAYSGAIVYWGQPSDAQHLEHIRVSAGHTSPAIRNRLIKESVRLLVSNGFQTVYVLLLSPALSIGRVRRWKTVLTRLGFRLRTHGYRFEWRSNAGLPMAASQLRFVTVEEAGYHVWRKADTRVRQGSLDPPDFTPFGFLRPRTEKWWRLAYDRSGSVVGLVQPGQNESGPTIEWIGVVPEQRGRGYIHELLAGGMAVLSTAGADTIRADTHVRNRAMQRALRQAGFDRIGVRWWYEYSAAKRGR
jgi:ribosomal protein S18 acetylase RimI-like enzyme